jgi:hypothetical protein
LTTASTVTCGHSPGIVQTTSLAKLKVGGQPVLLRSSIDGAAVTLCGTTPASDPSGVTAKPCTAVSGVSAGASLKLKTGGKAVVLDTLAGSTDGMVAKVTPQMALAAVANQSKLRAS